MKAIVKKISGEPGQVNFPAVKKNCINDNRYAIKKTPDGKHSFKIKAANGVPVVDSVDFATEQEMLETVRLIKARIPECETEFRKN